MKSSGRLRLRLLSCLVVGLGLGIAAVLLFSGYVWDSLYARHVRAEQRWMQRKPDHYLYQIEIISSFWVNHFQIEIKNKGIQGIIDLDSGKPAELSTMEPGSYLHNTNALWDFLLVDNIFRNIKSAIRPPFSAKDFFARANPNLFYILAMRGTLPFDWQGCVPAYPQVTYDGEYSFPSEVHLYGQPCSTVIELVMPIRIVIKDFERLP